MSFLQILSGFKGRLGRLPYFGYSLLLLVLVLAPVLGGAGLIGMNRSRTDNVIVGGLLIALAIVLGVWCGLALLIKRLHDMGMAGAHAIWIYGIYVVAANAAASEAFGILFNLVSFGIWLWLLFAPGQLHANRYGPSPGPQSGNGLDQQENFQQRQPVSTPSVLRPGRLKQRLLLIGLALAVAIGLAVWSMRPVPLKNRAIFEQAIANLAEAQGLRYKDTTYAGKGERDVTVTSSGQQFGSLTWMGQKSEVLRADGTLYARNMNSSAEPVAGQALGISRGGAGKGSSGNQAEPVAGQALDISPQNRWTLGNPGYNRQASQMLEPFISPRLLADRLSLALKDLPDAPAAYDNIRPDLVVGGGPALRADTSAGILYVSRNPPHRVLRLEPSTAQKWRSLLAGILRQDLNVTDGADLFPLFDSDAEQMYETLTDLIEQLADAVDTSIRFKLDGGGTVSCSNNGCSVDTGFTGTLSADARVRITAGDALVSMTAAFTIDGRSAGRCSSQAKTFPFAGSAVSGRLSCFAPEAGPVFAAVYAEHEARARAVTPPGQTTTIYVPYGAQYLVVANACAAGEVKRRRDNIQRERKQAAAQARINRRAKPVNLPSIGAAPPAAGGGGGGKPPSKTPGGGVGADGTPEKPAGELISGRLKRSPSYHSELASFTQRELEKMARGKGGQATKAKQMLKLIKEGERLRKKGNKK